MFGFGKKTSDEELQRIFSSLFEDLFNSSLPSSEELYANITAILNNKKARSNSPNDYVNSLQKNIGYYVIFHERIFAEITNFLSEKSCKSNSQVNSLLATIQEQVKNSESEWMPRFHKSYSKFEDVPTKIEQLEYDYAYNSTLNQILLNATAHLFCNEIIINTLINAEPKRVTEFCTSYVVHYTRIALGQIKVDIRAS